MANIKSQIKRNRQNDTRRARNKAAMSELKSAMKKVTVAAGAGEPTDDLFRNAQQQIDRAVAHGLLKPNTGARRKARLAAKL